MLIDDKTNRRLVDRLFSIINYCFLAFIIIILLRIKYASNIINYTR